jgi:hypothetical protein
VLTLRIEMLAIPLFILGILTAAVGAARWALFAPHSQHY